MALKIEKIWGGVFGSSPAVKRKEDNASGGGRHSKQEEQQQPKQDDSEKQKADKASVEKAIEELKKSPEFSQNGLRVEVIETKLGLDVRLTQASGAVLKVMPAEEFLKLHGNTNTGKLTRGKILDQKF